MPSLFYRWLERAAANHPAAPALIVENTLFTFAALRADPAPLPQRLASLLDQPELPGMAELLIATSGSTGEPKQVMLTAANLAAAVRASRQRIPLEPGDVWLNCLPLRHIGGMMIFFRCVEAGAAVLWHEAFDAARVHEALTRHEVTHLSLVPAMLARLLEAGAPPPCLKYALIGGGPLSTRLAQRARAAGWPVCPTYGLSEAASQVATLAALPSGWQAGMAGTPLPDMEVAIVDEENSPVAGEGRIRIRGPMVMAGYANPAGESGHGLEDGWFLTGDRGYLDAAGNLFVLGRHDEMLVSGGINIHPAEVEKCLLACPGIEDAAVTATADDIWGDRLVALLVGEAPPAEAQAWCQVHLPSPLRPRSFVLVAALPRNALGKLERTRLAALVRQAEPISC